MIWPYLVIIFMTLLGAVGGMFFKKASAAKLGLNRHFLTPLGVGAFFYLVSAVLNIGVLKFLPYTVAFPLTSLTYLWTLSIAYFYLKEPLTYRKISGVILILIGGWLLVI